LVAIYNAYMDKDYRLNRVLLNGKHRFVVADMSGKIVDDAKGYGYSTMKAAHKAYSFNKKIVKLEFSSPEFGVFADVRDGKKYKTVKIGKQTWLAENFAYSLSGAGVLYEHSAEYAKYGLFYTWKDAMKACPPGWRLPSYDDWWELVEYCGGDRDDDREFGIHSKMVANLKSKRGWASENGNDRFGFNAEPCGRCKGIYNGVGDFEDDYDYAYWWSSTKNERGFPYVFWINNSIYSCFENRERLFTVRLIKD